MAAITSYALTTIWMKILSFDGQWASDLYSRYNCRIMCFEPVPEFARRIEERFRHNQRIQVYEFGLGAETREEPIYICGTGSSVYWRSRTHYGREFIHIYDVKELFKKEAINHVSLMKINIEGGEYELLERLIETRLLNYIENLQVQFHNIERDSEGRMNSIYQGLRETHTPIYQYKFVWESWTQLRK